MTNKPKLNIFQKIACRLSCMWQDMVLLFRKIFFDKQDFERSLKVLEEIKQSYQNKHPFEIIMSFKGYGEYTSIASKQTPSEVKELYRIVQEMKPKVVCEIGTYKGGTLYLWSQAASKDALLLSCDLPLGLRNAFSENRRRFYQHFATNGQRLQFFPGDSHSSEIRDAVTKTLGNTKIDFLFIDGDHSFSGVKADFENFAPLVRDGGIIAFHDIFPRPEFPEIEVHKFWNDLKNTYKRTQEVKANKDERPIGIGVLWKE